MKSFSNETLYFFLRKLGFYYILDLTTTVLALRVSSQKLTRHFVCNKRARSTGEPCTCDYDT